MDYTITTHDKRDFHNVNNGAYVGSLIYYTENSMGGKQQCLPILQFVVYKSQLALYSYQHELSFELYNDRITLQIRYKLRRNEIRCRRELDNLLTV